jgi:hypothetical protein
MSDIYVKTRRTKIFEASAMSHFNSTATSIECRYSMSSFASREPCIGKTISEVA